MLAMVASRPDSKVIMRKSWEYVGKCAVSNAVSVAVFSFNASARRPWRSYFVPRRRRLITPSKPAMSLRSLLEAWSIFISGLLSSKTEPLIFRSWEPYLSMVR